MQYKKLYHCFCFLFHHASVAFKLKSKNGVWAANESNNDLAENDATGVPFKLPTISKTSGNRCIMTNLFKRNYKFKKKKPTKVFTIYLMNRF